MRCVAIADGAHLLIERYDIRISPHTHPKPISLSLLRRRPRQWGPLSSPSFLYQRTQSNGTASSQARFTNGSHNSAWAAKNKRRGSARMLRGPKAPREPEQGMAPFTRSLPEHALIGAPEMYAKQIDCTDELFVYERD